jgi:N-acetylglutamate synthase-like GNAT family acetyltransferase
MDADYAKAIATNEVWVVTDEGRIVGALVLRIEPDHVFIDNVAVEPDSQGKGIGQALLEQAEVRAAALRVPEVRLLTHKLMNENRAMYAQLGWEEAEHRTEGRFSRVYFRKPVAPSAAD